MTLLLLGYALGLVWVGASCERARRETLRTERKVQRARRVLHEKATAPGFAPDAADHHSEASA